MRTMLIGAAMAAGMATGAMADGSAMVAAGAHAYGSGVVVVSCFRGPWRETIWDHPEAIFTDTLRAVGYDYATAESIANRVCRDYNLVGDDAALKAEMERIIAESPNFRQF